MDLTLNRNVTQVELSGIRQFTYLVRDTPGACALTLGEPDLNTPDAIKEAAKAALDANDTHYPPGNGNPYVLEAISKFEAAAHGLHYSPNEIILTVGATEALFASFCTILNPGDEVIIPTPAFGLYEALVKLQGGVPVFLPTEDSHFQILPEALTAGEDAGLLTEEGAALLDVSGNLKSGIPMCPPEGDAGTGMAATNSVRVRTGNVSAGTSVFAMVVLEKPLKKVHPEIDLVTTPDGSPVAMVHCNNCTSDLNAWVGLFREFAQSAGMKLEDNELFGLLYRKALEGDKDCGGLLAYNYLSGEHITGFEEGRPLVVRRPDSHFNLANFMRANLFTALATLKTGLDILFEEEDVKLDLLSGHGGLFKTKDVGLKMMTAAAGVPVSVLETAGQGGAWGIALLAAYMLEHKEGETLSEYLDQRIFAGTESAEASPDPEDVEGFAGFMEYFRKGLPIERAAVESL